MKRANNTIQNKQTKNKNTNENNSICENTFRAIIIIDNDEKNKKNIRLLAIW